MIHTAKCVTKAARIHTQTERDRERSPLVCVCSLERENEDRAAAVSVAGACRYHVSQADLGPLTSTKWCRIHFVPAGANYFIKCAAKFSI